MNEVRGREKRDEKRKRRYRWIFLEVVLLQCRIFARNFRIIKSHANRLIRKVVLPRVPPNGGF
jgi:hypothetical protein